MLIAKLTHCNIHIKNKKKSPQFLYRNQAEHGDKVNMLHKLTAYWKWAVSSFPEPVIYRCGNIKSIIFGKCQKCLFLINAPHKMDIIIRKCNTFNIFCEIRFFDAWLLLFTYWPLHVGSTGRTHPKLPEDLAF